MLNINVNDLAAIESNTSNDFAPIPDGKYCAVLVSATDEAKTSQAGSDYQCVNVQYKLVGKFENRRVFSRYIYQHATSEMAAEIGLKNLKGLYSALDCSGPLTVTALEASDKCIELVLKTKPSKNAQYPDRQEVAFVNVCKGCPTEAATDAPAPPANDIW